MADTWFKFLLSTRDVLRTNLGLKTDDHGCDLSCFRLSPSGQILT